MHTLTSCTVPAESKEENVLLKNELRRSTMKIAELEARLSVSFMFRNMHGTVLTSPGYLRIARYQSFER